MLDLGLPATAKGPRLHRPKLGRISTRNQGITEHGLCNERLAVKVGREFRQRDQLVVDLVHALIHQHKQAAEVPPQVCVQAGFPGI